MSLWWSANLVLLLVVIPFLVVLLNRLMKPVARIGREADAILAGAGTIAAQLDLLEGLVVTKDNVRRIHSGVVAYGAALDKIL